MSLITLLACLWTGFAEAQSRSKEAVVKVGLGVLSNTVLPAYANQAGAPLAPTFRIVKIDPPSAMIGEDIFLDIGDLPAEWLDKDRLNESNLVLYLNGEEVKGLRPLRVGPNRLRFRLESTKDSSPAWDRLLKRPTLSPRMVQLSIGPEGEPSRALPPGGVEFRLIILPPMRFWISLLFVGVSLGLVLWFAPRSALLRDRTAPNVPVREKPWSLGKSQMAFWWILVLAAFLLTWAVKGQSEGIPESILGLIGIASGTALGAAVIEVNRTPKDAAQRAQAEATQASLEAEVNKLKGTESQARISLNANVAKKQPLDETLMAATAIRQMKARELDAVTAELSNSALDPAKRNQLESRRNSLNDNLTKLTADEDKAKAALDAYEATRTALAQNLESISADLKTKINQLDVVTKDLAAGEPRSTGFLTDLLSDVDGVSLHRFQIVVWTLVLGVLFVFRLWEQLRMPEFETSLLALMGISAGTYLGFKIPEKTA